MSTHADPDCLTSIAVPIERKAATLYICETNAAENLIDYDHRRRAEKVHWQKCSLGSGFGRETTSAY
jgi:hypothetical protein